MARSLRNKFKPFLKKFSGLQRAVGFSLSLYFLEQLNGLWKFQLLPSQFSYLMFEHYSFMAFEVTPFLLRIILLHVLFGVCLWFIEWLFEVKRPYFLYLSVVLYFLLFMLVYHPQAFEEFDFLTQPILFLAPYWSPNWPIALGFFVVLYLNWGLKFHRHDGRTALRICASLAILVFVLYSQNPNVEPLNLLFSKQSDKSSRAAKPPNVIVISVDSLRYDADFSRAEKSEALRKFLDSAYRFKASVSPIAKTHPALISLFTGKNPTDHGARSFLPESAIHTDLLLKNSLVSQMHDSGYTTEFMTDSSQYSYFDQGAIFDKVVAPTRGLASMIYPALVRSRLLFGLFDNWLGHWVVPEMRSNVSFVGLNNPKSFSFDVRGELRRLSHKDRPFFLMAHSCILHHPSSLMYPYYPRTSAYSPALGPPFGMFRVTNITQSFTNIPVFAEKQSLAMNEMYDRGVLQVSELYLEPILQEIENLGLSENSIVVLMSDHGETINMRGPFRVLRAPGHGESLMYSQDSEKAFLAVRLPKNKGQIVDKTVAFIDILKGVLSYVGISNEPSTDVISKTLSKSELPNDERAIYTETANTPTKIINSYNGMTPIWLSPIDLLQIDKETANLYQNPAYFDSMVARKERAVVKGDHRLSLFWTNYGYQVFLCNQRVDPSCMINKARVSDPLTASLWTSLLGFIEEDAKKKWILPGSLDQPPWAQHPIVKTDLASSFELGLHDINRNQWWLFKHASELIFQWHDYRRGEALISRLLDNSSVDEGIKRSSRASILDACIASAYTKEIFPKFYTNFFNPDDKINFNAFVFPYQSFLCASTLGDASTIALYKKSLTFVMLRSGFESPELPGEVMSDADRYALKLSRAEPFSIDAYKNAFELKEYAAAGDVRAQAALSRYENVISSKVSNPFVDILGNSKMTQKQRLEELYWALGADWDHGNFDEKNDFYEKTESALKKENFDEAVDEIAKRLSYEALPLKYFNHVLKFSDELEVPSLANKFRSQDIKLLAYEVPENSYDFDIQIHERSLALLKLSFFACRSPQTQHCANSQGYVRRIPETKYWKSLLNAAKNQKDIESIIADKKFPALVRAAARKILVTHFQRQSSMRR